MPKHRCWRRRPAWVRPKVWRPSPNKHPVLWKRCPTLLIKWISRTWCLSQSLKFKFGVILHNGNDRSCRFAEGVRFIFWMVEFIMPRQWTTSPVIVTTHNPCTVLFKRFNPMKIKSLLLLSTLLTSSACIAVEKIIPTDAYGNRQWNQTNYRAEGNKLIPTDAFGNRQWKQPNYRVEGNKMITTDSYGNLLWKQQQYTIKK